MAHQRPLCGPRDDSRVSLALMPFRPFGGLCHPPAGRFAKKPRLEAFCVILFELFGGGNGVCKSYNFILRPQIACKSGFPNGQKYSRRRQNDTPYSPPPPGRLRRRLYFEPHLTCGSLPRPRARTRPRDAARPAVRCRSGWHGGYILFPAPGLVK